MRAREKVSLFVVLNLVSFFCISGLQSEKTCLASEKQLPTESVYAGDEVLAIKGTVSVRAICGNTWSDGENYFYQYNHIFYMVKNHMCIYRNYVNLFYSFSHLHLQV